VCLIEQGDVGAVGELSEILQRLEPSLGPVGRGPAPLEGGITNRNYRALLGEREYVIRLHGKDTDLLGISREAERMANETAARLGIAPAVAAEFEGGLVTEFLSCESLGGPDLEGRAEELGVALRAFHDSGLELPAKFWVPDLLADYTDLIHGKGAGLGGAYEQAVALAGQIAEAIGTEGALRPCHNDLLAGNIILSRDSGRVILVDWEYAGMGHPFFDLGNLSVNNDFLETTDNRLLRAYLGESPSEAQAAALKLMRVLSDVREGAWGVMQSQVSDLEFDFDGYATEHFNRMSAAATRPEFARWLSVVGS
jgi:thiamine kinase-like enzyme